MKRLLIFLYGLIGYLLFFVTILYAIGFVGSFGVPKAINDGPVVGLGEALLVNSAILVLFVVQHTIMARPAYKQWVTRYLAQPMVRSTFVIAASAILLLLFWQWRPMPTVLWDVQQPVAWWALFGASMVGWLMVFFSSFLIDHFDLFGLRQVILHLRGMPYEERPFVVRSLYRFVRHPLMLGFLIAFWFTPTMTWGHFFFAAMTTGYIFFGVNVEERDLIRHHGENYLAYRRRTSMILPLKAPAPAVTASGDESSRQSVTA